MNQLISQGREQLELEDSPIQNNSPSHVKRKIPGSGLQKPTKSFPQCLPDTLQSSHGSQYGHSQTQ